MEDEHQSTLKKKIQILFQLGKWPDVVKLCDSYSEKYGKDMEIDMIRFKSERHLGIPVPPSAQPMAAVPAVPVEEEPPLVLSDAQGAVEIEAPPAEVPLAMEAPMPVVMENADSVQPEIDETDMFGSDPYAENELVITDPFELDEPGMKMAPDQPPVSLRDVAPEDAFDIPHIAALEMDGPADAPPPSPGGEEEIDFKNAGTMTIDADPELMEMAAPAIPASRPGGEERPDDPFRSGAGSVDAVEEPDPEWPAAFSRPEAEEKPSRSAPSFHAMGEEKAVPRKKLFTLKLALLILLPLLAAVSLWLALTGKLNFSGAEEPVARTEPARETPVVRRPRPKAKVAPAVVAPLVDEQEKAFNEKFRQAEELYKKGDLLKAWAVLLEAKKIKSTEPLRLLEELLATQIRAAEEQAKQQTQVVQSQWELETKAFERAEAEDTLGAWRSFLTAFPQGEFASRAEKKIANFEKKALELAEQQLLLKIQQAQKIRPRNAYLGLSQADIAAMLNRNGKPPTQFEAYERGGVKMMLDYASGLMWTLWNKPMAYDKAKWWANRVTAGYGGWRLPTVEEALALLQADRGQYSGLAGFSVWTGDTVSDQARMAWVLKFPEGRFSPTGYTEGAYVWAVRKAGK
jgi:hypothetical protein